MRKIVLPQAFRIVIPPLTNEIILLTKDSSLVYVLGVTARTHRAHQVRPATCSTSTSTRRRSSSPALCYLIITLPLSQLVRRLEIRYAKAR